MLKQTLVRKLDTLKSKEAKLVFMLAYAELGLEDQLLEVIACKLDCAKSRKAFLELFEEQSEGVLRVVESPSFLVNWERHLEALVKIVPEKTLRRKIDNHKKKIEDFVTKRDALESVLLENGQDLRKVCSFLYED